MPTIHNSLTYQVRLRTMTVAVLLTSLFSGLSVQASLDSLKLLLRESMPDTHRVRLLNEMAKVSLFQDADSSLGYAQRALKLSEKLDYDRGRANSLAALGTAYNNKRDPRAQDYLMRAANLLEAIGDHGSVGRCHIRIGVLFAQQQQTDSALFHLRKGLEASLKAGDSTGVSGAYLNIGTVYYQTGAYEQAAENLFKAAELKGQLNDKPGQAALYNNIASLFFILEDHERGLRYMYGAIKLNKELKDEFRLVKNYNNLLDVYFELGETDSALHYARLALEIAQRQDNPANLYGIYESLGNNYAGIDPAKALEYNLKAYEVYSSLEKTQDYNILTLNIASGLIDAGRPQEARPFLDEALTALERNQTPGLQAVAYATVARISAALGDFEAAYNYQLLSASLEDSIRSAERMEAVAKVEAKYQTAEQEKTIQQLENEKGMAELRAQQQEAWLWVTALGLLLLVVAASIVYRAYLQKQRSNKLLALKNEENEALLKEIHHRVKNNLQIISSLLNLQSATVSDATALDAIKEGQNRVKSIALIHQKLYQTDDLSKVDFEEYVEQLTAHLNKTYHTAEKRIGISTEAHGIEMDIDTAVPLGLIINELVTNAFKHAFEGRDEGEIHIELSAEGDNLKLTVRDNGNGLPEGFNLAKCESLGLKLVGLLSRQLKGDSVWQKEEGTLFRLQFQEQNLVHAT